MATRDTRAYIECWALALPKADRRTARRVANDLQIQRGVESSLLRRRGIRVEGDGVPTADGRART